MKFYLETQGCQMNEHDSEVARAIFVRHGLEESDSPDEADVVVLNTCSVRAGAEKRAISRLNDLARRIQPHALLGAMGCVVERLKEAIFESVHRLDFALGPDALGHLPEILVNRSRRRFWPGEDSLSVLPRLSEGPIRWLVAMRGCNSFCSYCIVPYVRGRERSRPPDEILAEAAELVRLGAREIVVLGQNLAAYSYQGWTLARLLEALSALPGIGWIRYETFYPSDVRADLLERIASEPKLCKFIHTPIQTGSDPVLRAMNRRYTVAEFVELVRNARRIIPGVALSGDLIVGFPTETEADHQNTLRVLDEVRYDFLFHFKYSPRPGTAAYALGDPIPDEVKARRLRDVMLLQRRISAEKNRELVGRELAVLVTSTNPKKPGELQGRTQTNRIVFFEGASSLIGTFVTVKITSSSNFSLRGSIEAVRDQRLPPMMR